MVAIAGHESGKLGFGLMGLTWRPKQTPDDVAFPLLKKAISLGQTFWNSGEFYGSPEPSLNLQLLNRYFAKYPEDRSKVFISVKGCIDLSGGGMRADSTPAGVRKSVEHSCDVLGSHIDLFEAARVDAKTPIEETMRAFKQLIDEGKIKCVGLSECSAQTIRRAHKVLPIAAVEQEYSLWATEIEGNGVLAACAELGIPLVAYSPLGRGFLTGEIRKRSDIPENDMRLHFDRFSEENFPKNLELVAKLEQIAKDKGVKPSQLAVGWVLAQQAKHKGLEILPIPGCTSIPRLEENAGGAEVKLTGADLDKIQTVLDGTTITGLRYNKHAEGGLYGETREDK